MSKRTTFTTISPLPPGVTREVVVEFLHNHQEMIDLNPLVKERHAIKPPSHATPEEFHCTWYSLTDRIAYLPGGFASGDVTYTCAFHDLPNGIQTHCYAPAGLNIRDKWTLNGSMPGEPVEPVELGIGAPLTGLYIREDVDMKCNMVMTSFVKKTLKKSHAALIERLKVKAQIATAAKTNARLAKGLAPSSSSPASIRSDLSHRSSWTRSRGGSASSSAPSSVQSSMPSPYQSPPSSAPSFGFPSPQYSFTQQSFVPSGATYPHPDQARYNSSFPYPPQLHHQHSSPPPPAYGRYEPVPSQQQRYYHPPPPQQANPDEETGLVPAPLRTTHQQDSAPTRNSSTTTTSSSVYRDCHGRVTWAAIKPHQQPSVRYRVAHPDYPQLNPYAAEDRAGSVPDRQVPLPSCRNQVRIMAFDHVTGAAASSAFTGAILRGPFVAELEG